jgi:glycosyltransferase involved in cell wall biosynthesis
MVAEKGHHLFIDAIGRVAPEMPDVRFTIVGDGDLMEGLQKSVGALDLQRHVEFLGARRDARAIIAGLDLLVAPSLSDGSPLVVLEALSAGVPVLAAAVGDIPEQIVSGINGLLVPPGDTDALAHALRGAILRPGVLSRLRAGARDTRGRETHDSMVERVVDVYRDAMARRSSHHALAAQRPYHSAMAGPTDETT